MDVNGLPVSAGLHDVKASESHLEGLAKLQTTHPHPKEFKAKATKCMNYL
jgi:hypothetical protein